MGILTKIIGLKLTQKAVNHINARRKAVEAQQAYAPAAAAPAPRRLLGNPVAQRAAGFYQRNPKLVATLGTVVLAAIAAGVAKKRGMI